MTLRSVWVSALKMVIADWLSPYNRKGQPGADAKKWIPVFRRKPALNIGMDHVYELD
jgi:hypothetical protein